MQYAGLTKPIVGGKEPSNVKAFRFQRHPFEETSSDDNCSR